MKDTGEYPLRLHKLLKLETKSILEGFGYRTKEEIWVGSSRPERAHLHIAGQFLDTSIGMECPRSWERIDVIGLLKGDLPPAFLTSHPSILLARTAAIEVSVGSDPMKEARKLRKYPFGFKAVLNKVSGRAFGVPIVRLDILERFVGIHTAKSTPIGQLSKFLE